jgi:hypothetical protein
MSTPLFSFIHVTDTHYSKDLPTLRHFVELTNSESYFRLPDFVIHTGDIIRGYNSSKNTHYAQMCEAKAILDKLKLPVYLSFHNHDTFGEEVRGSIFDEVFATPHFHDFEKQGFYFMLFSGALLSSPIYGKPPETGPFPEWGYDLDTSEGLALLSAKLKAHARDWALVFSHKGLFSPRSEPIWDKDDNSPHELSGYNYCLEEHRAAPIRSIFENSGNVIAHYSGHCHINSRRVHRGINYISTASLENFPGEFRLVEVYQTYLRNTMYRVKGGDTLPFRFPGVTDAEHATQEIYFSGNPDERDFDVSFKEES